MYKFVVQVRASDTKDKPTLEVSISADQPFDSDSGKSGQSESLNSYQPSVKDSQQKHIDSDESRSIKSVKDEFDRLGMKMPKGIIFKEEKIEKETDKLKVLKTTEKANERQQQEKMPLTRRSSDISYFLRGMRKKYKKKIKVPRNYSCEKCEFQSPDPQKYYKHVLYIHTGRQIQCDKCDKKYFSMSHLKEHIEGHHEAGSHEIFPAIKGHRIEQSAQEEAQGARISKPARVTVSANPSSKLRDQSKQVKHKAG